MLRQRPNIVGWVLGWFFFVGGIVFWILIPQIWLGQIWVAVSVFLMLFYSFLNRRARAAERLRLEGIAGKATILGVTQTGLMVNHQPVVKLKLRIEASGLPPYEVEKRVTVPLIALGSLTSGQPLSVYIEPDNHERFTIDWGAAIVPITFRSGGGAPFSLGHNPAAAQEVLRALEKHGIEAAANVDLRENPAARAEVVEVLRKHGVDAAHDAAAAEPTLPIAPPVEGDEPMARLTKLKQLRDADLISAKEYAAERKRILREI